MKISKEKYFEIQDSFESVPFILSREWHDAYYSDKNVCYFVDSIDNPIICCFGLAYKKTFLGRKLNIEAESYKNESVAVADVRNFYKSIIDEGYDNIEVSSVRQYSTIYEVGIRQAGFLRPLVASLCPLTITVDTGNFSPARIWKRHINNSIKELVFYAIDKPTIDDITIFCSFFLEVKARKKLNFDLDTRQLSALLDNMHFKLFFVGLGDQYVAGRIVYLWRNSASDVYAANSELSRKYSASYFLMDSIFKWLLVNSVSKFDFSRIPPSNKPINSVYEFKSYSGGTVVQYNGQWSYYKNWYIERLIYIYHIFKSSSSVRY